MLLLMDSAYGDHLLTFVLHLPLFSVVLVPRSIWDQPLATLPLVLAHDSPIRVRCVLTRMGDPV